MKMTSVKLVKKDGGEYNLMCKTAAGFFLDIKDGGVLISSRDENNGWFIVAFYTTDLIASVIPQYDNK